MKKPHWSTSIDNCINTKTMTKKQLCETWAQSKTENKEKLNSELRRKEHKPITRQEIIDARKKLLNNKSSPNEMKNELLRYGGEEILDYLETLLNTVYKHERVPKSWRQGKIKSLYKKGAKDDPCNYRPITLLCPVGKLYATILNLRLNSYIENENLLSTTQNGFRTRNSRNCLDHVFTLEETRKICNENSLDLYYAFIDFKSAFDMVPRDAIFHALMEMKANIADIQAIQKLYKTTTAKAMFNGKESREFNIHQGVAQGCPLSPTLFAVFINKLLETLNQSREGVKLKSCTCNNLAYADDIVLLAHSREGLQKLINITAKWCKNHGMKANVSKCASMTNKEEYEPFYWNDI